jgi:hypothetical protein
MKGRGTHVGLEKRDVVLVERAGILLVHDIILRLWSHGCPPDERCLLRRRGEAAAAQVRGSEEFGDAFVWVLQSSDFVLSIFSYLLCKRGFCTV